MSGKRRAKDRGAWLPLKVLTNPGVQAMSHAEFRVLVMLTAEYNGHNNGALGVTKAQAATNGISNRTLYRALRKLEETGVITKTYPASRTPPRPTMYGLTWWALDDTKYTQSTRKPERIFRMNGNGQIGIRGA